MGTLFDCRHKSTMISGEEPSSAVYSIASSYAETKLSADPLPLRRLIFREEECTDQPQEILYTRFSAPELGRLC